MLYHLYVTKVSVVPVGLSQSWRSLSHVRQSSRGSYSTSLNRNSSTATIQTTGAMEAFLSMHSGGYKVIVHLLKRKHVLKKDMYKLHVANHRQMMI